MSAKDTDVVMELCVETLTGSVFEFEVSSLDTIMSVKAKIQRLEGIPASQQHLIWRSKELEDDCTLQDYCITDGTTLKLVISMRGGPINTRRIPVEDPTWKEITEYMEANREEIWEKLPGGRQVTLLVFRDGDQINFLRLMDRSDGTVAPVAESICTSPMRSVCITEELEGVDQRLRENNATMQKMRSIRKQMEAMNLKKKLPRKKVVSSRQSVNATLTMVGKAKSTKTSHSHSLRLPPIPSGHHLIGSRMATPTLAAADADTPILGIGLVPRLASQSRDRDLRRRHLTGSSSDRDPPTSPPVVQLTVGDGGVLRVETSCSSDSDELESRRWNQSSWSTSLVDSRENLGRTDGRSGGGGGSTTARDGAVAMGILSPASEIPTRRHQLRGSTQPTGSSIDNLEQLQQTLAKFDPRISVQARIPRTPSNRSNMDGGMGFLVRRMTVDKESAAAAAGGGGDGVRPKTSSGVPPPLSLARPNRGAAGAPTRHLVSLLASTDKGEARSKCVIHAASHHHSDGNSSSSKLSSSSKSGHHQIRNADKDGAAKKSSFKDVGKTSLNGRTVDGGLTVLPLEQTTSARVPPVKVDTAVPTIKKPHHRRCFVCKRKTGLATSYSCRCGENFCATHRYAETHDCNYDYKTEGRRFLERTNPLVTAQKLPEI